jgi:uncharacterized Rmd1/YagE family protein
MLRTIFAKKSFNPSSFKALSQNQSFSCSTNAQRFSINHFQCNSIKLTPRATSIHTFSTCTRLAQLRRVQHCAYSSQSHPQQGNKTAPRDVHHFAPDIPVEREIKVMCHYVGRLDLAQAYLAWPGAVRFARPDSVLVPLDSLLTTQPPAEIEKNANEFVQNSAIQHPTPPTPSTSAAVAAASAAASESFNILSSYAIVFPYGAVVFFGASDYQQQHFLNRLPAQKSSQIKLKDDYKVQIAPALFESANYVDLSVVHPHKFGPDSVIVNSLDSNMIRIVSQVLAQTIGMEFYEQKASQMLEEFRNMTDTMEKTGDLNTDETGSLVRLLAQNNSILTDVLTQLRVLDRSEIAWRFGEYDALWQGLRSEFDLQQRFGAMETKLKLIHDNHPLFLEVLHHKKSTRMEIIIIALIAIEVILSVLFHSPIVPYFANLLGYGGGEA